MVSVIAIQNVIVIVHITIVIVNVIPIIIARVHPNRNHNNVETSICK